MITVFNPDYINIFLHSKARLHRSLAYLRLRGKIIFYSNIDIYNNQIKLDMALNMEYEVFI